MAGRPVLVVLCPMIASELLCQHEDKIVGCMQLSCLASLAPAKQHPTASNSQRLDSQWSGFLRGVLLVYILYLGSINNIYPRFATLSALASWLKPRTHKTFQSTCLTTLSNTFAAQHTSNNTTGEYPAVKTSKCDNNPPCEIAR
jgi:hypothetical protein